MSLFKTTHNKENRKKYFLSGLTVSTLIIIYILSSKLILTEDFINKIKTDVLNYSKPVEETIIPERENPFKDLKSTNENAEAIITLFYRGIITGYADGTFRPEQKINRAELTKILVEAANVDFTTIETEKLGNCFGDVGGILESWFTPFVCAAKYKGWIQGYAGNVFMPARKISKAEGLKIILEVFGFNILNSEEITEMPYKDVSEDSWYLGVAKAGKSNKLISDELNFNPSKELTRAEVAQMIYSAMKSKGLL